MSALEREDWLYLTPKDILHVWKYEDRPAAARQIVLFPIDFNQLAEAEAASQRGETNVRIVGAKVTLNGSAAAIWEMCDGTHTIAEMAQSLAQRYRVSCEQVQADIRRLLQRLEPYNVLELDWSPL
jgi:hypothetical protein